MTKTAFLQWLDAPVRPPLVMGVLNVTPDSFSDGGKFVDPDAASQQAEAMVAAGADMIDIGGESTRPGSEPISADVQIQRVLPVLRRIAGLPVTISIDTTQSAVAEAALDAGAAVINDISAGRDDPKMFSVAAGRGVPIILMHMRGTPRTMQDSPHYADVIDEVATFLRDRLAAAERAGISPSRLLIDPGIGFGKSLDHNLTLIRRQREFGALGRPVVIGTSRKAFIGKITGESDPSHRQFGTAASVAYAVANGAGIVRVHDVGPMVQVVRMMRAILGDTDFLAT